MAGWSLPGKMHLQTVLFVWPKVAKTREAVVARQLSQVHCEITLDSASPMYMFPAIHNGQVNHIAGGFVRHDSAAETRRKRSQASSHPVLAFTGAAEESALSQLLPTRGEYRRSMARECDGRGLASLSSQVIDASIQQSM